MPVEIAVAAAAAFVALGSAWLLSSPLPEEYRLSRGLGYSRAATVWFLMPLWGVAVVGLVTASVVAYRLALLRG